MSATPPARPGSGRPMHLPDRQALARIAAALALGAGGALLFHLPGLPAASLSGSALAVAVAAVAGVPLGVPPVMRRIAFVVLGTGMGAAVTPEAFAAMGDLAGAVVVNLAVVALVALLSIAVFRRIGGFDMATAVCASMPGALSQVMALAIERGLDVPRIALAQALRLLVLVAVLPFVATFLGAEGAPGDGHLPPVAGPLSSLAMLVLCTGAALLAARMRMPAGYLLGAFAASAALHGLGLFSTRLPVTLMEPALVLLGTAIGAAFAGTRRQDLLATLSVASLSLGLALAVAAAAALAFSSLTGAPLGEIMLAFAPGGIEAMITLAFVLGYDVPFVAALHVARVAALVVAMPLVLRLVTPRAGPDRTG